MNTINNEANTNETYEFKNQYLKVVFDKGQKLLSINETIADFIEDSVASVNNGATFEDAIYDAIVCGYRTAIIQLDSIYDHIINNTK